MYRSPLSSADFFPFGTWRRWSGDAHGAVGGARQHAVEQIQMPDEGGLAGEQEAEAIMVVAVAVVAEAVWGWPAFELGRSIRHAKPTRAVTASFGVPQIASSLFSLFTALLTGSPRL